MAIINDSAPQNVRGIEDTEKQRILDFLHGAVYCWCNIHKDKWFAARDLVGGDNTLWENIPLMALYLKHKYLGKETPEDGAAIDAGWLLKTVLWNDARHFESRDEFVKEYRWLPNSGAQ